jgi:hypothetical protein
MMKQIVVHGQRVKLYSPDGGHTWSSVPQAIAAFGQRKKMMRLELQNRFARIDEMRELDPAKFSKLHVTKSLSEANKKNQARSIVGKIQLARLDTGRAASDAYVQRMDRFGDPIGLLDHGTFHRERHPREHSRRPHHVAR